MTDQRICGVDDCDNPMPTGDNSTACPRCWARFDYTLGDIPALIVDLETTITRQSVVGGRNGGRGTETPLPFHQAASDALRLLTGALWPWVREGIEEHRDRIALPAGLNADAVTLSRTLLRLHGWLVVHPDGVAAIDEITYAVSQCRRVIDLAPDRWYCGICSAEMEGARCTEELYVIAGHHEVKCPTCGTTHDVVERRDAMLDAAEDQLLTLSEMTRALALTGRETVSRKQLEGWVRRGRLVRSGNDGATALYRVSDVRDILAAVQRA